METVGESSSRIVPTPVSSAIVPLTGALSFTWNCSSASAAVSPLTRTVTVPASFPALIRRVPLVGR